LSRIKGLLLICTIPAHWYIISILPKSFLVRKCLQGSGWLHYWAHIFDCSQNGLFLICTTPAHWCNVFLLPESSLVRHAYKWLVDCILSSYIWLQSTGLIVIHTMPTHWCKLFLLPKSSMEKIYSLVIVILVIESFPPTNEYLIE
jgi:hypothetical protein